MRNLGDDKPSKTSRLAEHIRKQFDENKDLTSPQARKTDFEEFCKANPDDEFSRSLYVETFQKVLDEKGINRMSYGMKKSIPTFRKSGSKDMKTNVKVAPSSQPSQPSEKPSVAKTETKTDSKTELKEELNDIELKFTTENVGATIKGLYAFAKWKYPFLDDLDDDDKRDLGDLWLPAFEHYVKGKYAIVAIPAMASIGILKGKVNEKKKEEWDKKRHIKKTKDEDLK